MLGCRVNIKGASFGEPWFPKRVVLAPHHPPSLQKGSAVGHRRSPKLGLVNAFLRRASSALALPVIVVLGLAVAIGAASGSGRGAGRQVSAEYLSASLSDRIVSVTQGWGEMGFDVCAHMPGQSPLKLRIGDKEYAHGLGHHANGEIVVDLGGQFLTFAAEVGVEWQGQDVGSVRFRVFVDDKPAFDSGVMHESDRAKPVSISVKGGRILRLVAEDGGDGIICDAADWAEAQLVRDSNAPKADRMGAIDMAPFATVAWWDPKVTTGTSARRVTEFPAKDIAPYKELQAGADGGYLIPVGGKVGCIGLQWVENRNLRELSLRFPPGTSRPNRNQVSMQFWEGDSVWQGNWVDSGIEAQASGNSLTWRIGLNALSRGTPKVRWLVHAPQAGLRVSQIRALTRSLTREVRLRIEPASAKGWRPAEVTLYNGVLLGANGRSRRSWDGKTPLEMTVRTAVTQSYKADRTVLRFRMPDRAFGVAVEDLLANDAVYVPTANLYVTRVPAPKSKAAFMLGLAKRSSVLDDVRRRPDQSFAKAWKVVHNPVQDLGPTLLSLACDNRKFEVEREGSIVFNTYDKPDDGRWETEYAPGAWTLATKCGIDGRLPVSRHLEGGWYPIPSAEVIEGDVRYRQTTCVAPSSAPVPSAPIWLRERAACVTQVEVRNAGIAPSPAQLAIAVNSSAHQAITVKSVSEGFLVMAADRVLALIDSRGIGLLSIARNGEGFLLSGNLPSGGVARLAITLPAWRIDEEGYRALLQGGDAISKTKRYWDAMLSTAMQIEVPDRFLTDLIRASQVNCMIAARCEDGGARIAPWISADRYGPLESEANSIMRGMDMNGQTDFARRCLDYFVAKTNSAGFITTGYTLVGTGECLWTLGEHYERTRDRAWLQQNAPLIKRICRWVIQQRQKTKLLDARGGKVPEFGLMPPGVTADWGRFSFRLFNDAQYQLGLQLAGKALQNIGDPSASTILADASAYRTDILRAYYWAEARTPVVPLASGAWVTGAPSLLDCFGPVEEFFPGEDAGRTWCYSIEAGAHHLIANGILPAKSGEADSIVNNLEDVQFLRSGWGDYPEGRNRVDLFDFGGFSKLQPYYTRIAEVHALRDDVKPFVRSYFNAIPALASGENLTFWEHLHNMGGWNKTHETGWFLCQTRTMFLTERGDDLWLAPFVTNQWLKNGMRVSVRNAPSKFGTVSYSLRSSVASRKIDAVIELPNGFRGRRLVLRLRHPDGRRLHSVTVQGKPWRSFDAKNDTVTLRPESKRITVSARY